MFTIRQTLGQRLLLTILFAILSCVGPFGCSDGKKQQAGPGTAGSTERAQPDEAPTSAASPGNATKTASLNDQQLQDLVTRSYQYVAMYNVNNKFAAKLGGWNKCDADTQLKDHTMREIARPNNDTLYISCLLDLRAEPVILNVPAFDTDYASLMVTAYDHYVNVPISTRQGDFQQPTKILFYSERTKNYDGQPVEGINEIFETTGDFVSAVFRIMPHSHDKERFSKITKQMISVAPITLSEFQGATAKTEEPAEFPDTGETDVAVFGSNLLEMMQFVFNHTTFDPDNPEDQALLALYKPLGVEPGKAFDPDTVAHIDNNRLRDKAEKIQQEMLRTSSDEAFMAKLQPKMFQPKGETDLETLLVVSVFGPIGLPQEEAVYPSINTRDGKPMNAMHDYVLHMSKDALPPAGAFWSLTLYDLKNGFFIPNERKKYSVGENAGMKLDEDGGISIYIAASKPEGVPEENWLPIERKDIDLSLTMRVYVPDLEKLTNWDAPKAERINGE